MRRLVASAAIVVALTFATIGALIAARSLWPEPAPDAPRPSRVVNVDVRP